MQCNTCNWEFEIFILKRKKTKFKFRSDSDECKKCMVCPECNGRLVTGAQVPYTYEGQFFGVYEANKCKKCKATYFTESSMNKIEQKAKKLGLFGNK